VIHLVALAASVLALIVAIIACVLVGKTLRRVEAARLVTERQIDATAHLLDALRADIRATTEQVGRRVVPFRRNGRS
jgi:biopolymer transport protein ExbB/TolQ